MCFINTDIILNQFIYKTVMMEEHLLQKLVKHGEPKPSFNIIVIANTAKLQIVLHPPLVFTADGSSSHYEMALVELETYYSFPNIKPTNNCMNISIDKGVAWKSIKIPIGCYEIKAINKLLPRC